MEHLGDEAWLEGAGHRGYVLERCVLYLALFPFVFLFPGYHEASSVVALSPGTNPNVLSCPRPGNNGSKSSPTETFPPSSRFSQAFSHCDGTQTEMGFSEVTR